MGIYFENNREVLQHAQIQARLYHPYCPIHITISSFLRLLLDLEVPLLPGNIMCRLNLISHQMYQCFCFVIVADLENPYRRPN